MANQQKASRIGGITVAMGLGVAVTTGHGVASADSATDGEGAKTPTTSQQPEAAPADQKNGSGSAGSPSNAAQRTAQQRRETVRAALREHLSAPTRRIREDKREEKPDTAVNPDVSPDGDDPIAINDVVSTVKRVTERKSEGATVQRVVQQVHKRVEQQVATRRQVTTPVRAALTQATAPAVSVAQAMTTAPVSRRISTSAVPLLSPSASGITAAPAPLTAPARVTRPVNLLAGLLTGAALRPNAAAPGVPQVPVLPRLLELAYAAWRRVVVPRVFNSTPTATVAVDYDGRNNVTDDVSGAVQGRDADNDTLTYEVVQGPATGSLDFQSDGTFTYTPDQQDPGDVTFTVRVSDETSRPHLHLFSRTRHSTTATVTIDIDQINQAPAISVSLPDPQADGTTRFTVTPTDPDIGDRNSLQVTWTDPANGTVAPVAGLTNVYAYTPDAGYPHTLSAATPDPFTFVVTDQYGKTATADAKPIVRPVNTAPVLSVNEVRLLTGEIVYKLTATDADGDTVYVTVPDPSSTTTKGTFDRTGVVAIAPGQEVSLIYTPDASTVHTMAAPTSVSFQFVGDDRLYQGVSQPAGVTTAINPVNRAADVTVTTTQLSDSRIAFTIRAADLDGDSVTVTAPTVAATEGSFDIAGPVTLANGESQTFVFTPTTGYAHELSAPTARDFSFALNDGLYQGAATEHVNATVQPDNDAPVLTVGTPQKQADGSFTIALSATDGDGDSVRVAPPVLNPNFGSWQGLDADGTVTLLPNTVRTITFVPNPVTTTTTVAFEFFANDGRYLGTDTESVAVTIEPAPNEPPSFVVTNVSQPDSTTGKVTITYTKSDPDNDPVTLSVAQGQLDPNATFVDNGNGTATYTPDRSIVRGIGPSGTALADTFTIVASDGRGESVSQDVTATVKFTNQAPYAQFENPAPTVDLATGKVHGFVRIVDPDGDTNLSFTYAALSPAEPHGKGHLEFNLATGEYEFTPNAAARAAAAVPDAPFSDRYAILVVTVTDGYNQLQTGAQVLPITPIAIVVNPPPTVPPTVPPRDEPGGPGEVQM